MENPRYPGLQLDEDMKLQRREWRLQRIAWCFLYALLAAIILGLLGNGPLSHTHARTQDGSMEVEYERFMRRRAPETVRLTVVPASDSLRLQVAGPYIRQLEIKKIVPEPETAIPSADEMIFVFEAAPGKPMQIAFHFQPEKIGVLEGWMALEGKPSLALRHFVYP